MTELEFEKIVIEAFDKVYSGNTRENTGEIENHLSDNLKKYYLGLANKEEWALKKQRELFDKIKALDLESLCKDLDE